jgi:protein-glutamine gamma-glutamyltransferase
MDIERVKRLRQSLTLHFAIIACITAILVANNGSGSIFLPVLIVLVTTTAFIFVDLLEIFYLGQVGSYVGMALATILALGTLVIGALNERLTESSQLLSVAGLLIYPQCVLFFQKKSLRVFEQLAVFLLLQMIVAALINDNIVYGILLTPMLLAWVSSLFLFARYSTIVSLSPDVEEPVPLLYELLYAKYLRPALKGKRDMQSSIQTEAVVEASALTAKARQRWMLSGPLGIAALLFGGALFYFLPRNGQSSSLASLSLDRTGIPDRLNPGFFGRVLSDPTPVFRLKMTKEGKSFRPQEPPYLRVDVFDRYIPPRKAHEIGNWLRGTALFRRQRSLEYTKFPNRDRVNVDVKGKNSIPGKSTKILVSLPPLLEKVEHFSYDRSMMIFEQISEDHKLAHKKYLHYEYDTGAYSDGELVEITPDASQSEHVELTSLGVYLPLVDKLLSDVVERAQIDPSNAYAVAKTLESHFRDSGQYTYTLDVPPMYETTIDPIEDFVTGLCQHYASALVATLRHARIPSRIVIGYRPVVWNKMGDFFQVRLADAHAWVEALVDRNDLVGTEHERRLSDHQKYWLLLDPTPGVDNLAVAIDEQNKPLEYAEELWNNYLSNPDVGNMQASYAPMAKASQDQAKQLMSALGNYGKVIFGEWFGGLGFAWQLALTIIVIGGVAIAIWQGIRWLPRLAPNLAFRLGIARPSVNIQQPFFARCVVLLESLKLKRPESETLNEFSHRALESIESRTETLGKVRESLLSLATLYHRLRFSKNQTLDQVEQPIVEQHLQTVEAAVKAAKKRPH